MKIWPILLMLSLSIQAADWPRWRGETADGGWNPKGVPADLAEQQPQEMWQVDIGGGYGGVTVSQGRVYLLDWPREPVDIERILCYAAEDGQLLWSHQWPAVYGRMDYGNGPRSSVTVADGKAYVLGAVGMAACLDAAQGKVIWQVDMVREHGAMVPTWGFAASPVLDADRVLLHVGAQPDGSVIALNKESGKRVWRGGQDPAGYSTPEIITHEGVRQLIAWGPENIQSLNPETGILLWTYPYEVTYGVSIAQPLYRDGVLLISGYWHGTKALRPDAKPTLVWENEKEMCGLMSSPLYKDGVVFLLDKNKGLQGIELATGKILWSDANTLTPKDRNPQMSLVWLRQADGLVALLNASGELVYARLTATGFEELARHQIIGKTWAHPAFVDNRIYARSDTSLVAWRLWKDS